MTSITAATADPTTLIIIILLSLSHIIYSVVVSVTHATVYTRWTFRRRMPPHVVKLRIFLRNELHTYLRRDGDDDEGLLEYIDRKRLSLLQSLVMNIIIYSVRRI